MPDMPPCRDCRWWEPIDEPGMGLCTMLSGYEREHWIQIYIGHSASNLITGELFGCVKWETRTDA